MKLGNKIDASADKDAPALSPGAISRRWVWLLCGVTAVGWQLCFPTVGLGPMAYVVLVPWVVAMALAPRRGAMLAAWATGVATFGAGLYWLTWVTMVGYLAAIVYLGVYFLIAAWFVRRSAAARVPLWLTLPIVWVALEYARAYMLSGFPWFFLAHSQYRFTRLIQIADVTGAYGVSFLVAMVNGLVADVVLRFLGRRGRGVHPIPSRWWSIAGGSTVIVLAGAMLIYGNFRLGIADEARSLGPRIAVVQSAVPISLHTRADDRDEDMFDSLIRLTGELDLEQIDLVVWPETVLPYMFDKHWDIDKPWSEVDPDRYADPAREYFRKMRDRHSRLASLLAATDTPLLAGGMTVRRNLRPLRGEPPHNLLNSAMLLAPESPETLGVIDVYAKMHCVPFSEYVPFRDSWPWFHRVLRVFVPSVMEQLTPGKRVVHFRFGAGDQAWTAAAAICYEGVFARVCRQLCHQDGRKAVDVLINISNDGWFIWPFGTNAWPSSELDQHLSAYVFRAIENRVPVVRAVNTGVSGFIDSCGRIVAKVVDEPTGATRMVEGSATRTVLVDPLRSRYSIVGDVAAQVCCVAAAVLGVGLWWRNRAFKG